MNYFSNLIDNGFRQVFLFLPFGVNRQKIGQILFILCFVVYVPSGSVSGQENNQNLPEEIQKTMNQQKKQGKGENLDESLTQRSKDLVRPKIKYLTGGPKVSLNFSNASIEDVLRSIAAQTDLNLIISDKVGGKTSVNLKNVPAKQAIKDILDINGLYYIEEPNKVIKIVTEEEYRKLALSYLTVTRVFKIFQGNIKSIANSVGPALTERVGKITVDERSNHLVITDVPGNMERIERILRPFTEPKKKIKISAHILEVQLNDQTQLGINWEATAGNVESINSQFSASQNSTGNGSLTILGKAKQPFSKMRPTDFVQATLSMMGVDLNITTLATPTIIANDSEKALIHIGRSIPYNETTTAGVNNSQTTSFKFLEVGTKLSFLPRYVQEKNMINLDIDIEVSSSPGFVAFGKDGELGKAPEKVSTTARTVVNLTDGQRIIIGGLLSRKKTRETAGIPFLKDIPILKYLFGSSVYATVTQETVIFITAEIIDQDKKIPRRLQKTMQDVGTKDQLKSLRIEPKKKD